MKYISNHEALRDLAIWLMGGLWGANWGTVVLLLPPVVLSVAALLRMAWSLNAMSAGEAVATNLGVNVRRLRLGSLLIATLVASGTIAFTGIVGFIGLMSPHISRMLLGNDNRFLIPGSALLGGILLLLADTIGRVIMAPTEIPAGIVTSALGVPFFVYLLARQKRQLWS